MTTQELWQAQALDAPRVSVVFVRQRLDALRHRTQMRNALEYVSAAFGVVVVVWSGWHMWLGKPLMQLAIVLWIVGLLVVSIGWHRRAASQEQPGAFGVLDALQFYRRQLERQRDARRGNWRWWLPPSLPGIAMMFVGFIVEYRPIPWLAIGVLAAWVTVGFSLAVVGYERSARRIQQEIDALDSLAGVR